MRWWGWLLIAIACHVALDFIQIIVAGFYLRALMPPNEDELYHHDLTDQAP